jgi:hypothetical protein
MYLCRFVGGSREGGHGWAEQGSENDMRRHLPQSSWHLLEEPGILDSRPNIPPSWNRPAGAIKSLLLSLWHRSLVKFHRASTATIVGRNLQTRIPTSTKATSHSSRGGEAGNDPKKRRAKSTRLTSAKSRERVLRRRAAAAHDTYPVDVRL